MNIELRPATQKILVEFFGRQPGETVRALVAYVDGVPMAVGGVTVEQNRMVAFSDIRPGLNVPKITIWRHAKKMMEFIAKSNAPILAACRSDNLSSQRFVEQLGFTYLHHEEGCGEVYVWK